MPIRRASDNLHRPEPPPKRSTGSPWPLIGLLLAVLLVAGSTAGFLWIRPWVAGPPVELAEIDATWAQVVTWGAPGAESGGDPALLLRAITALAPVRDVVDAALAPEGEPGRLQPEPAALTRALELLVDWSEQGGGMGADPCLAGMPASVSILDYLSLARAACAFSAGPDDPRLVAGLRLGEQLRDRGGLVHFSVGMSVATSTLELAEERGLPPEALRPSRPTTEAVFPALAREATCFYQEAERALSSGSGAPSPQMSLPARLATEKRELAMLRWWQGEQLTAGHAVRHDLAALGSVMDVPDGDQLPRSTLVRLVVPGGQRWMLEQAQETIERYDAFLAGR